MPNHGARNFRPRCCSAARRSGEYFRRNRNPCATCDHQCVEADASARLGLARPSRRSSPTDDFTRAGGNGHMAAGAHVAHDAASTRSSTVRARWPSAVSAGGQSPVRGTTGSSNVFSWTRSGSTWARRFNARCPGARQPQEPARGLAPRRVVPGWLTPARAGGRRGRSAARRFAPTVATVLCSLVRRRPVWQCAEAQAQGGRWRRDRQRPARGEMPPRVVTGAGVAAGAAALRSTGSVAAWQMAAPPAAAAHHRPDEQKPKRLESMEQSLSCNSSSRKARRQRPPARGVKARNFEVAQRCPAADDCHLTGRVQNPAMTLRLPSPEPFSRSWPRPPRHGSRQAQGKTAAPENDEEYTS